MADITTCAPLTRESVFEARALIRPYVHYTPVLTNRTLTTLASTPRTPSELEASERWKGRTPAIPTMRLWFKCENLQRIGAFKVRGAFHAIEKLKREPGWVDGGGMQRGVVTHSSGNHAQALALAAKTSGIPAYIVMPTISAPPKIAATKGYGANVIFSGSTSTEREAVAAKVIEETGARLVPPYDHPDIILGQGTMGLELQEQVERLKNSDSGGDHDFGFRAEVTRDSTMADMDTKSKHLNKALDAIITPCGGGGMLSGVALSAEGTGIHVFGAEPEFEGADDAKRGFASGERVETVSSLTVADGLRTPVGVNNWGVMYERRLVRDIYSASEDEIRAALRLVLERFKMVIEPSAAVPLAVALYNEDFRALVEKEAGAEGWDIGIVLSGGNVSLENLASLLAKPE